MSSKYHCDRCDKIIEKEHQATDVITKNYLMFHKKEDAYDLCPECLNDFETKFLKNVKFKDEE